MATSEGFSAEEKSLIQHLKARPRCIEESDPHFEQALRAYAGGIGETGHNGQVIISFEITQLKVT